MEKLVLNTLFERKMSGDLIETFKTMESLIIVKIFVNISLKQEIYCQDRFQN